MHAMPTPSRYEVSKLRAYHTVNLDIHAMPSPPSCYDGFKLRHYIYVYGKSQMYAMQSPQFPYDGSNVLQVPLALHVPGFV